MIYPPAISHSNGNHGPVINHLLYQRYLKIPYVKLPEGNLQNKNVNQWRYRSSFQLETVKYLITSDTSQTFAAVYLDVHPS